jgi:hypothetical protein
MATDDEKFKAQWDSIKETIRKRMAAFMFCKLDTTPNPDRTVSYNGVNYHLHINIFTGSTLVEYARYENPGDFVELFAGDMEQAIKLFSGLYLVHEDQQYKLGDF